MIFNLRDIFESNRALSYMKARDDIKHGIPHISRRRNKGCIGIHGKRECERRMRQIAKGQLKKENGLVA